MTVVRQLDEDMWVVPDEWWAHADRFRGRGPARPRAIDASAVATYREYLAHGRIPGILNNTAAQGFPDIAAAGTAALGYGRQPAPDAATPGEGQESPLGAAALACIITDVYRYGYGRRHTPDTIVDAWIAQHGLIFATEAAIQLAGLFIMPAHANRGVNALRPIHPGAPYSADSTPVLRRVRAALAELPEPEYRAAVERFAAYRVAPHSLAARLATTYLFPTEQHWLDADIPALEQFQSHARDDARTGLICCATTAGQLSELAPAGGVLFDWDHLRDTVAAHLGPAVAPFMAEALDNTGIGPDTQRVLAGMLAQFPTDQAFSILLERLERNTVRASLHTALIRFPRRALRLLAANSSRSAGAAALLRAQAHAHPELAAELGIAVEPAPSVVPYNGIATPDELPAILRVPPWEREKPPTDSIVLPIPGPRPSTLRWREGEREAWAEARTGVAGPRPDAETGQTWSSLITDTLAVPGRAEYRLVPLFACAPVEVVAPHLSLLEPRHFGRDGSGMTRLLGRFGEQILPVILAAVAADPEQHAGILAPVTGSEVTALMAKLLGKHHAFDTALEWLERHLDTAAADLIAAALGKAVRPRKYAWDALHLLARRGHRDALFEAAAAYDARALEALRAELVTDPMLHLPKKIPVLPSWLMPAALPPIVLRDSRTALDVPAVATVCTMLAIAKEQGGYAGVQVVEEAADPRSLTEFAWGMFEAWRAVDYPPAGGWILRALADFGDDDIARRLTPLIRVWPGDGAHQRAVAGLNVLAAIGTDIALMQLNGIAEKVKFNGIRSTAHTMIERIARDRGLTTEQLADRLVPDLGLSEDGTLPLDYGPRGFRIGLDEQLRPTVSDADGAPRKSLPKPGVNDDPELAPAAYKAFAAFKKDVKAIAGGQLRRLEQAMVRGRRWTADEFPRLFVDHPLVRQLTRRLVWVAFAADGTITGAFRLAEDRSLADAHDNEFLLAADATVGVAHPLHLGDDLAAWAEIFADYELLQPFPQLTREIHRFTDAEATEIHLDRFQGIEFASGNAMRLVNRGWGRESPQDAGDISCFYQVLGNGHSIVVHFDPGFSAGQPPDIKGNHQVLRRVWVTDTGNEHRWCRKEDCHPLGVLDAIPASELVRDLEAVIA